NIITTSLVVAAIWSLYLASVSSVAVAVHPNDDSRWVGTVATGGLFVSIAASLITIAWIR
ncbi:MAG: hypothetical protein ACRDNO_29260, partial [Trebonia sp.]